MNVINLNNNEIDNNKQYRLKFYLYDKNKIRSTDIGIVNVGLIIPEDLRIVEHHMNLFRTKAYFTLEIYNTGAFREYWIQLNRTAIATVHFISITELKGDD